MLPQRVSHKKENLGTKSSTKSQHKGWEGDFLYVLPETILDIFQQTPVCSQLFKKFLITPAKGLYTRAEPQNKPHNVTNLYVWRLKTNLPNTNRADHNPFRVIYFMLVFLPNVKGFRTMAGLQFLPILRLANIYDSTFSWIPYQTCSSWNSLHSTCRLDDDYCSENQFEFTDLLECL